MANQFTALSDTERFFYRHAGYSYNPAKETKQRGRIRCARELARAEKYARDAAWEFEWESDWGVGSHKEYFGAGSAYEEREPETCESCACRNADGDVLALLGCIDDADANYRRVIEAELADEALHTIEMAMKRETDVERFVAESYAL